MDGGERESADEGEERRRSNAFGCTGDATFSNVTHAGRPTNMSNERSEWSCSILCGTSIFWFQFPLLFSPAGSDPPIQPQFTQSDAAEQTSGQLRQELEKVRAEAGKLQGYKEETEELRTTVDKLEMELDEVRRMTSMHSKESSAQPHSNPSTITRRLGNELARSMELDGHSSGEETQVDGKDADTSNVDDYISTDLRVLPTRLRRR